MANLKGSIMLHTVKALRRHRALVDETIPPHLQQYLETPILHSSWYSEQDHLELFRLLGRLAEKMGGDEPGGNLWERYGQITARRDLTDIYDVLVTPGNPTRTLEKLGALWALYHDTGRFEVKMLARDRAELNLYGYEIVAPEVCINTGGYITEMLRVAGATEVSVEKSLCRVEGDDHCRWNVAWQEVQEGGRRPPAQT